MNGKDNIISCILIGTPYKIKVNHYLYLTENKDVYLRNSSNRRNILSLSDYIVLLKLTLIYYLLRKYVFSKNCFRCFVESNSLEIINAPFSHLFTCPIFYTNTHQENKLKYKSKVSY